MSYPVDSLEEFGMWIIGVIICYIVMYLIIGGGIELIFFISTLFR